MPTQVNTVEEIEALARALSLAITKGDAAGLENVKQVETALRSAMQGLQSDTTAQVKAIAARLFALENQRPVEPPPPVPASYRKPRAAIMQHDIAWGWTTPPADLVNALARHDEIALGLYSLSATPAKVKALILAIKAKNPRAKVYVYTIPSETQVDPAKRPRRTVFDKLVPEADRRKSWLLNAAGEQVAWTPGYDAKDLNMSMRAPRGEDGKLWHTVHVELEFADKFKDGQPWDGAWIDNHGSPAPIPGGADWFGEGKNRPYSDNEVWASTQDGYEFYRAEWDRITGRKLTYFGNQTNQFVRNDFSQPQSKGKVQGWLERFIVDPARSNWGVERNLGFAKALAYYRTVQQNSANGVVGVSIWGTRSDAKLLSFGICTVLLGDGHAAIDPGDKGQPAWAPELDAPLGDAIEPMPTAAVGGVWSRKYANGLVLVNPDGTASRTVGLPQAYRKLDGTALGAATVVTLPARTGLLLLKAA